LGESPAPLLSLAVKLTTASEAIKSDKAMKTKILIPLLILACLLTMPATAQVNYAISGSTAYVTNSPDAYGDIVIASSYQGYAVTRILNEAFVNCDGLTSVTIPDSITSIGGFAFEDCSSLTSVTIGNSVTSIGEGAFYICTSLTSVTIPDSVRSIGHFAFQSCNGLTNVMFGNGVASIGYAAFSYCGLTSVTIPNSVTSIGALAFQYSTRLTNVTFLGNAPTGSLGRIDASAKVYYYYGTTGWEPTYDGWPTVMLGAPAPQVGTGSAGVKPGGFGFTLNGVTNQTIVVEASTNLVNWQPIWTSTLSTLSTNFADPDWANYPHRFYRLRSN
jgi:hypothetical protein